MHFINPTEISRRAFLQRAAQMASTGVALPTAINLAAIADAAAYSATDYKALVCIFLYGGNDYANTLVTYDDDSYNKYSQIRGGGPDQSKGGIALAKQDLAATLLQPSTQLPEGRQYALHPSMSGMTQLFQTGKMAVQLNVGPLVVPITQAQYFLRNNALYPVPPKLFSHNDQQSVWQSHSPEGSTLGWGGQLGDLALASNSNALFTCMSVTGNAVLLSGNKAHPYQISSSDPVPIRSMTGNNKVYGSAAVRQAMVNLAKETYGHILEDEYCKVLNRSIAATQTLIPALQNVTLATPFPANNSLADQLKMVARLIKARTGLGNKRQVFMVSMDGFDLHDHLLDEHSDLMTQLSQAVKAFYDATVELGVANQVTSFTASEFGRSLTSNGDGSDHGWGSHHFVMGGAVNGKAFYGKAPPVRILAESADPQDQGQIGFGRLIPSTSVDQYVATLAKWFGVSSSEMPLVLPNLKNFGGNDYPVDLGFMA